MQDYPHFTAILDSVYSLYPIHSRTQLMTPLEINEIRSLEDGLS